MKSFVHPKLRRKTREWEFLWYGNTIHYEIGKTLSDKIVFWSKPHTYTEQELLALWFEEVVEKDWIDKVIDEITFSVNWTITQPSDYFNNMMRQAIEKHMPPQKKFTLNKLIKRVETKRGNVTPQELSQIEVFLRDHDLLEE